jgi:predicted DNA binding CopG/RHH family protein
MPSKADTPKVPKFETEAAEARWWDEHKSMVEASLRDAMRDGTAQRGAARRLVREARESKNITIRMPLRDIERARSLAEKRGIGYQTYMKMLLHEALEREENRKAG